MSLDMRGDTIEPEARVCRLADGRRIAFRSFGAAEGFPLVALHGLPGSSLKFAATDAPARAHGLRVVALDRWGYGQTDSHPRPSLGAYAEDMAQLLDGLGIGRYAVMGVSGGGPYAAALAAAHGHRVAALALVSPVGPIVGTPAAAALLPFHRFAFVTLARQPWILELAFRAFRRGLALWPDAAMRAVVARAPRVDRLVMRDPAIRDRLARSFALGLAPGVAGCGTDMALFSRAWDVPLAAVTAPARLWLGTADRNVPIAAARGLAAALPACELTEMPGEGHLWVARHYDEVLRWVANAVGGAHNCALPPATNDTDQAGARP